MDGSAVISVAQVHRVINWPRGQLLVLLALGKLRLGLLMAESNRVCVAVVGELFDALHTLDDSARSVNWLLGRGVWLVSWRLILWQRGVVLDCARVFTLLLLLVSLRLVGLKGLILLWSFWHVLIRFLTVSKVLRLLSRLWLGANLRIVRSRILISFHHVLSSLRVVRSLVLWGWSGCVACRLLKVFNLRIRFREFAL